MASPWLPMRSWTGSALAGGLLWLPYLLYLLASGIQTSQAVGEALLLWGSLVAVPLALGLVDPRSDPRSRRGRWALARWGHLPCAITLLVALVVEPGTAAGLWSLPWLAFCGFVTLLGVLRFCERGGGPVHSIAVDAGLVFLVVGGIWTTASRFGSMLLGFAEPWVLLTGVHFHFAGLVLPIVTGLLARAAPGTLGSLASFGVITGVPLVATGITVGARGLHAVEWLCALWMMAAALLTAILLVRQKGPVALWVGGTCLFAAMLLVGVHATGVWVGGSWIGIPAMVLSHGILNAFGFAVPALVALRQGGFADDTPRMEILVPLLGDVPAAGIWESRGFSRAVPATDSRAAVDTYERRLSREGFLAVAAAIMRYEAFPPTEMRGLVPRSPVEAGDTLRARCRFLPGVDVVFAARVVEVFDATRDGVQSIGFSYRTLAGHPIHGEETFAVTKSLATGEVLVRISARSRAGNWLSSLIRPIVRRRQRRAGAAAMAHLEEVAAAAHRG